MKMEKLLLILNPRAGTRHANRYLTDIVALFASHGYLSTVCVTDGRGDAARYAAEYGGDAAMIVCIGGDGTFNEVVTGVMRAGHKVPLGYIPAGSTNDFASSLRLSGNIMNAAHDIMQGTPHTLDVGRFGDRYFTYVASFGAFTRASYETPQNIKNALGHLAYILEGMKDLPAIRPEHVRFTVDGQAHEDDYIFGAVSNSTSLGGVLTLSPEIVDMNDGMFEIILIKMPKNAAELQTILTALGLRQYECDMIELIHTDRAEATVRAPMPWSLDGEYEPGKETVVIENIRDAIRLMTNTEETK